jgi:hypothetical protein
MVNPAQYQLYAPGGERLIAIEPVFEEITGGDLFPTGRYILYEDDRVLGEIHLDGDLLEWDGNGNLGADAIARIATFIREYNEPELAGFAD